MLTMPSSAVYLAAVKHDNNNVGGGVLTLYLIATAWMTARRADGETSIFDWVAFLIPLGTGTTSWLHGIRMLRTGGQEGPLYISMSFFMGTMMFLAAAGDLRMMLQGGVFGRQRVVRHLWRMCLRLALDSRVPAAISPDLLAHPRALLQRLKRDVSFAHWRCFGHQRMTW